MNMCVCVCEGEEGERHTRLQSAFRTETHCHKSTVRARSVYFARSEGLLRCVNWGRPWVWQWLLRHFTTCQCGFGGFAEPLCCLSGKNMILCMFIKDFEWIERRMASLVAWVLVDWSRERNNSRQEDMMSQRHFPSNVLMNKKWMQIQW